MSIKEARETVTELVLCVAELRKLKAVGRLNDNTADSLVACLSFAPPLMPEGFPRASSGSKRRQASQCRFTCKNVQAARQNIV